MVFQYCEQKSASMLTTLNLQRVKPVHARFYFGLFFKFLNQISTVMLACAGVGVSEGPGRHQLQRHLHGAQHP